MTNSRRNLKKHLLIGLKMFFIVLIFISISNNKSMASSNEDIYDVILFWGQSNMVGTSTKKKC